MGQKVTQQYEIAQSSSKNDLYFLTFINTNNSESFIEGGKNIMSICGHMGFVKIPYTQFYIPISKSIGSLVFCLEQTFLLSLR